MLVKKKPEPQPTGYKLIWLSHLVSVKVDPDDYVQLNKYFWRLRLSSHCFYAVRRVKRAGKTYEIKMHREIIKTPQGYDCHHINHNTLDNRRANLQNLDPATHALEHRLKERGGVIPMPPKSL